MCVGARTAAQAAWSSGTLAPGAPCVTIPGTWQTRRSCAASWAAGRPWMRPWGLPLGRARGLCGWTRWGAGAARHPCGAALRSPGDSETAATRRTRACAAPVSGWRRDRWWQVGWGLGWPPGGVPTGGCPGGCPVCIGLGLRGPAGACAAPLASGHSPSLAGDRGPPALPPALAHTPGRLLSLGLGSRPPVWPRLGPCVGSQGRQGVSRGRRGPRQPLGMPGPWLRPSQPLLWGHSCTSWGF